MIDTKGHISLIRTTEAMEAQKVEIVRIAGLLEDLARDGRSVEDVSLDELRSYGLSVDAIVLVINGTPEQVRSVLGRTAAFCVKHGNPFGPVA